MRWMAHTGAILWQTVLSTSANAYVWSSAAFSNGSLYIGLASVGDCPLVQGELFKLDAASGAIQASFPVVPNNPNLQCIGGSVWGSPTIDTTTNPATVYFGTGNPDPNNPTCGGSQNYSSSLVAVRATDLSYLSSWQLPSQQLACDGTYDRDFGATPTLFPENLTGYAQPQNMVGIANKDGIFYAFNRVNLLSEGPMWEYRIGIGSPDGKGGSVLYGSISSGAYDPTLNPNGDGTLGTLYIAGGTPPTSSSNDACYKYPSSVGSLQAFDLNVAITTTNPPPSPTAEWAVCFDNSAHPLQKGDSAVIGAVTAIANPNGAAPHEAIVGEGHWLVVVDGSTGTPNVFYTEDPNLRTVFASAASVAHGILYVGNSLSDGSSGYIEAFN
jgi:hypothetical protein